MDINIVDWLHSLPPVAIYVAALLIVGVESLGVPMPGETTLTIGGLLASQGIADPWIVWAAGASGAIIGDSIGYYIGRANGRRLFARLHRWFPNHVNARTVKMAEAAFRRHGALTVFFGRFIDILRIFAGPIAGMLKMPYPQFLRANAAGGIAWSGIVVWAVYFLGVIAEQWLHQFSWIALVITLAVSTFLMILFQRRVEAALRRRSRSVK